MPIDTTEFRHEYDLEAVECIRPLGHEFEMLVTPRYRHHYLDARYEAFMSRLVGAMSRRHRLFIDIGAHYGFFSLLAGGQNPEIEVLACEPVPESYEVLVRNLDLNRIARARPLRLAVSDRSGMATLNISLSSDNCSFYPHPVAPPIDQVEVETVTVDELLADHAPCPALLKMDTDGHELPVLAGMGNTLERFPDLKLFVELNPKMQRLAGHEPEDLLKELDRLGFEVYLLEDVDKRSYRLREPTAWRPLMKNPESYVNLYCCPKRTSLSVCFFSHSSLLSGAERSLLEMASELVEDHGTMCTAVLPDHGPLEERLEAAGVACLVAPLPWWCAPSDHLDQQGPRYPSLAGMLVPAADSLLGEPLRELREIAPHVLVTHTIVIPWGAFFAPFLGTPHVWHICEHGELDHGLRFFLPHPQVVEMIAGSSNFVFAATNGLRDQLFPCTGEGFCRTLYRHVAVPEPDPTALPTGHYGRPTAVRIGLFGSYSRNKGQDLALRAVADLVDKGRDVELLLAGQPGDPFELELRHLAHVLGLDDIVRMPGFLDDVYPAMSETDIVVIGSRREAFCRVAAEGMLLGKPVVYPNLGGPSEYLKDGLTGLVYEAGDHSAMASAIERLVDDQELRSELGRRAQEDARTLFTRERYGGTAVEVLRKLREAEPRAGQRWTELFAILADGARRHCTWLTGQYEAVAREHQAAKDEVGVLTEDLHRLRSEHARLRRDAEELHLRLDASSEERDRVELDLAQARQVLETILSGATWNVALWLRKPLDLVVPVGSRRRALLKRLVARLRGQVSDLR